MIKIDEARDMVDDIFEQQALLIGGILAVHGMEDDTVWRLIRNLDVIRGRVMRKLDDREDEDDVPDDVLHDKCACPREDAHREVNLKPHPAIQDFLIKIRRESEWLRSPSS